MSASPPDRSAPAPADGDGAGRVIYLLDAREFWRARELCWRALTGRLFLTLGPAGGLVALLTAVVMLGLGIRAELAPYFLLLGLGFLSTRRLRRRATRRAFRRLGGERAIEVHWGEGGLRIREGEEWREVPREAIEAVLITCGGYLIEPRGQRGVWLPYSGFAGVAEVDRFEAMVRAVGARVLDRRRVG
jgi:hypothetical protein